MTAPVFTPWSVGAPSLVVYGSLVAALLGVLLFLAHRLGERRTTLEKRRPYESGVVPTGPARVARPVPFYLVAMFFLVFDVEAAFLFSWAVAWDLLGWAGWFSCAAFVAVLALGLAYVWRKGGLDWGPRASSGRSAGLGGRSSGGPGSLNPLARGEVCARRNGLSSSGNLGLEPAWAAAGPPRPSPAPAPFQAAGSNGEERQREVGRRAGSHGS